MAEKDGYVPCAHCQATGTCRNGEGHRSCSLCIKKAQIKGTSSEGLICGVCKGLGVAEPQTLLIRNRITPVLAWVIVCIALLLVFHLAEKENFHEVLAFAATLIGSVTGYYFGDRSTNKILL
jgi:tRNA-binding EMAP/Myf-like protein